MRKYLRSVRETQHINGDIRAKGTQMGYSPTVLYMGGGYAKCEISIRLFEPPYYCDDENDHEGVQRGIDMYNNGE